MNQSLTNQAIHRDPMSGAGASGARFERLTMPDESIVIVKHFASEWDWTMRATQDPGRAALLWIEEWMNRVPDSIDTGVIAAEPADPGWRLYMRDVSANFLRRGTPITLELCLRAMRAAVDLHAAYLEVPVPHLCSPANLIGLCSPATIQREAGDEHPFLKAVHSGWQEFRNRVPHEIGEAILQIVDEPGPLLAALDSEPVTLLHGDLHFGNIGFDDDRVVMLDWGLATHGPLVLEWAWWAMQVSIIGGPPPWELLDAAHGLEPDLFSSRSLLLAPLVGLALAGWQFGHELPAGTTGNYLDWWISKARLAIPLLDE